MDCLLRYLPSLGLTDPYAASIERFIGQQFPQLSSGKTEDVMEAVMMEFLGTKQCRIGPRPNPESEVRMREVVRNAVREGAPIPILIASAAVKVPIGESADVAELSALRMLASLQERVVKHYAAGTQIVIRLEDLTEYAISATVPHIREHVTTYTRTIQKLIFALGYEKFILPLPESSLVGSSVTHMGGKGEARFLGEVAKFAALFTEYLTVTDGGYEDHGVDRVGEGRELYDAGWKGGVSKAMREYLRARYAKLYPDVPASEYNQMMGTYLACILVRRNMNAMGFPNGFPRLEIGFSAPLPDTPAIGTRVYYRTVPLSQSSLHMPFWNAKGFFKINQQGQPRISLGSWNGNYTPGQLEISNGTHTALLRADYTEED